MRYTAAIALGLLLGLPASAQADSQTSFEKSDDSPCNTPTWSEQAARMVATRLLRQRDPHPPRRREIGSHQLGKKIDLRKAKKKGSLRGAAKALDDDVHLVLHDAHGLSLVLSQKGKLASEFMVCTYQYTKLDRLDASALRKAWRRADGAVTARTGSKSSPAKLSVAAKRNAKRLSLVVVRGVYHDKQSRYRVAIRRK